MKKRSAESRVPHRAGVLAVRVLLLLGAVSLESPRAVTAQQPVSAARLTTGLEGNWRVCLTRTGSEESTCGTVRVDTLSRQIQGTHLDFLYHRFTHTIDLARVMGPRPPSQQRHGTMVLRSRPVSLEIELGLRPDQVFVADGGHLVAHLWWNGDTTSFRGVDSLSGPWGITCRAGCSGSGRITLTRPAGK